MINKDLNETKLVTQDKKLFQLPAGFNPNVRVSFRGNLPAPKVAVVKPATIAKPARVSLEGKINSRVDARDYRGNGHWIADIQMGTSKAIGFVYVIRNLEKQRYYIGKKFYKSQGKITKGNVTNWPWYISSCTQLAVDNKEQQKIGFDFIFIEEYVSRGALSWAETWSLCTAKIAEKPELFYNTLINKVSWKVREKITAKHEERLKQALNGEPF